MKLLVTGGAGFIGSNFIYYILNKYHDYYIVNLDLLTYAGNLENLKNIKNIEKYKFIRGDIANKEIIDCMFEKEKFDIVINFAAESHVDRSIKNPASFVNTNIVGTHNLLEASRKFKVKRFHQISTDEVYGDLPLDRLDMFFTEETPVNPSSPYSSSKAASDLLVMSYYRTYGFPSTISRCSNNYGPYHFPEKLIPLVISRALNNRSIPVYGRGENVRDWLYVEDHCCAIDLIIHDSDFGEVYNIGGHNEKTNLDVVRIILNTLNKSEELINYVSDRPGHDLRYAIDPKKMEKTFDWKAKYDFEKGIEVTIDWYLKNRNWWENIISGQYRNYFDEFYQI